MLMPQFVYCRRSFAYSVKSCWKNILLLHFLKCVCQPGKLSKHCAVTCRKRSQSWVLAYELGIGIKIRATLQTESIWKQDLVEVICLLFIGLTLVINYLLVLKEEILPVGICVSLYYSNIFYRCRFFIWTSKHMTLSLKLGFMLASC